jgi:hypothetical protein
MSSAIPNRWIGRANGSDLAFSGHFETNSSDFVEFNLRGLFY